MNFAWLPIVLGMSLFACEEEEAPVRPPKPPDTAQPPPESSSPWHCDDGEDNDLDGWVDCEDPDCETSEFCTEWVEDGDCGDGEDNDGDGLVDCEDSDCDEAEGCEESLNEDPDAGECMDGLDNDGDGLYDCNDPDCEDSEDCQVDDEECVEEKLEIDVFGPSNPEVGDSWTVWLRCDGVTLVGTAVVRFNPPTFATIDTNEVTFVEPGVAEMTVQVGAYRDSMTVTVTR